MSLKTQITQKNMKRNVYKFQLKLVLINSIWLIKWQNIETSLCTMQYHNNSTNIFLGQNKAIYVSLWCVHLKHLMFYDRIENNCLCTPILYSAHILFIIHLEQKTKNGNKCNLRKSSCCFDFIVIIWLFLFARLLYCYYYYYYLPTNISVKCAQYHWPFFLVKLSHGKCKRAQCVCMWFILFDYTVFE